jgi:hypothetical protein
MKRSSQKKYLIGPIIVFLFAILCTGCLSSKAYVKTDAPPLGTQAETKNTHLPQGLKARFSDSGENRRIVEESVAPPTRMPYSGAYMIHVASVKDRRLAEQFIEIQPADGSVRLSATVQLNPEKPWYRLLVGRFQTQDEARGYIQAMKQNGWSGAYVKPMKLPFSLRISSSRPWEPSRKIVDALRKIDYMAYLAPSTTAAKTFDVLVGAYGSRKEADSRAQLLLANGIPVEVLSP